MSQNLGRRFHPPCSRKAHLSRAQRTDLMSYSRAITRGDTIRADRGARREAFPTLDDPRQVAEALLAHVLHLYRSRAGSQAVGAPGYGQGERCCAPSSSATLVDSDHTCPRYSGAAPCAWLSSAEGQPARCTAPRRSRRPPWRSRVVPLVELEARHWRTLGGRPADRCRT